MTFKKSPYEMGNLELLTINHAVSGILFHYIPNGFDSHIDYIHIDRGKLIILSAVNLRLHVLVICSKDAITDTIPGICK